MGRLLATALAFLTIAAGPAPPASTPLTAGGEYEGRIVVCIAKAEAELHRANEDRLQTIAGHKITIGRHEEAISELNDQLAECQKLLGV